MPHRDPDALAVIPDSIRDPGSPAALFKRPFLHGQAGHAVEIAGLVGHKNTVFCNDVGGNQHVHGTHGLAAALQSRPDLGIVVRGFQRPGAHLKASQPGAVWRASARLDCGHS